MLRIHERDDWPDLRCWVTDRRQSNGQVRDWKHRAKELRHNHQDEQVAEAEATIAAEGGKYENGHDEEQKLVNLDVSDDWGESQATIPQVLPQDVQLLREQAYDGPCRPLHRKTE